MARRSSHNHINVPTVSVKSNYKVDGNLDLSGILSLTGKLVINGEEIVPGVGGGEVSIKAGDGIKIEGTKVSIDKDYIEEIVENSSVIEGFVSEKELSDAVEEISNRIDALAHFTVRVESELPENLIENSIYLIPSGDDKDVYTEYIAYKNSDDEIVAELIGSTKIDLSDYVTKDQLANLVTKEEIEDFVTSASLEETISEINSQLEVLTQATEECKARKHHVIVDAVPDPNKEEVDERLLYLVRNYKESSDTFDEYVYNPSTNRMERVGIDGSLYTKKSDFDVLSKDLTGYKISTDDYLGEVELRLTNLEKNSGGSTPGTGGSCDCGERLDVIEGEISDLWNSKANKTDFNNLSTKVTSIEGEIENIKNAIENGGTGGGGSCDCDLTEIESKINTLETSTSASFASVSSEIENIKGRLTAIEEANPESPETPSLDEYVKTEELEGILEIYAKKETVTSLSSKVGVNEAKINNLIARVTALEENSPDNPPESGDQEPEISGFEYGESYLSLGDLIDNIFNLEEGKVYSVTDKNTIEEYILKDGEVVQVSGGFNMQVSGDIEDTTAVSPMRDKIDANGEIMYNMPELVNGDFLFKGCDNLKVFVSDTPSLITARQMFYKCVNLETFCGVLSLLEDGTDMFVGCKLDEESILNIVDSINDFGQDGETRIITIGYNPESIIDGSIEDYTEEFSQKGWTVEWDPMS